MALTSKIVDGYKIFTSITPPHSWASPPDQSPTTLYTRLTSEKFNARKLDDARVFWWFDNSNAHTMPAWRKALADGTNIRIILRAYVDMVDENVLHIVDRSIVRTNFGTFKIKKENIDYYDSFEIRLDWAAAHVTITDETVGVGADTITTYSGTLDYPFYVRSITDIKDNGTALTNLSVGNYVNNVAPITADELGTGSTINRSTGAYKLVWTTQPATSNVLSMSYVVEAHYFDNFIVKVVCP